MGYIEYIRSKIGHDKIFLNCVGAAIQDENERVLLQRRADRNVWGFPGGVMELGESFEEAIQREVKEETGLNVEVADLIGIYSKYSDEYPNGDKAQPILAFFKCIIVSGELSTEDDETLELRFFEKSEQPELVNKQHIDMFNDLYSYSSRPIIS